MVRHLREGEGGKQEDSGTQQPALIGTGSNKVVFMKNSCPFSYYTSLREKQPGRHSITYQSRKNVLH